MLSTVSCRVSVRGCSSEVRSEWRWPAGTCSYLSGISLSYWSPVHCYSASWPHSSTTSSSQLPQGPPLCLPPNCQTPPLHSFLVMNKPWVRLVLLIFAWVWGYLLWHGQPTSIHVPKRKWLSLSHQLSGRSSFTKPLPHWLTFLHMIVNSKIMTDFPPNIEK